MDAAQLLADLCSAAEPGITTAELDTLFRQCAPKFDLTSAVFGYRGFPRHIVTSLNSTLSGGVPSTRQILKDGDLLTVDIAVERRGQMVDLAHSIAVGRSHPRHQSLLVASATAVLAAVSAVRPGVPTTAVAAAVEAAIGPSGAVVCNGLEGHDIGARLHGGVRIPHSKFDKCPEARFAPGMIVAVEPVIKFGSRDAQVGGDGYSWRAADGEAGAYFERTVLVTEDGAIDLTAPARAS
ncbi:M24 family metallopeptidase [Novosphingobium sp. BL-52-GroH]|uniref:M24 family metallopeptidase n=1 Tax=Novosphingobium sp. BL-52-GroH TaxID=3349877 RepID=UPI00385120F7